MRFDNAFSCPEMASMRSGMARLVCIVSLVLLSPNLFAQLTMDRIDPNIRAFNENERHEPFRMIGNIWWVGHSQVGAFLITTPEGHFLIDTTSEELAPWVVENIVKAGFHFEDIKYILNGHAHEEHMAGTPLFKKLIPHAQIVASKETAGIMASGGRTDFRNMYIGDDSRYFEPFQVDRIIGHQEEISLGGVTMVAHITPGHIEGNTTWTLKVEDDGKVYDAVIYGSLAVAGSDRGPLLNNKYHPEIMADFENSFEYMKNLKCDVFLYPRATSINLQDKIAQLKAGKNRVNPFVDPEGCQHFITYYEKRFEIQLEGEREHNH